MDTVQTGKRLPLNRQILATRSMGSGPGSVTGEPQQLPGCGGFGLCGASLRPALRARGLLQIFHVGRAQDAPTSVATSTIVLSPRLRSASGQPDLLTQAIVHQVNHEEGQHHVKVLRAIGIRTIRAIQAALQMSTLVKSRSPAQSRRIDP